MLHSQSLFMELLSFLNRWDKCINGYDKLINEYLTILLLNVTLIQVRQAQHVNEAVAVAAAALRSERNHDSRSCVLNLWKISTQPHRRNKPDPLEKSSTPPLLILSTERWQAWEARLEESTRKGRVSLAMKVKPENRFSVIKEQQKRRTHRGREWTKFGSPGTFSLGGIANAGFDTMEHQSKVV